VTAFWFPAWPRSRVAILRTALYLFVVVDVLWATGFVAPHGDVPGGLYQPLFIGRVLPLPTPTPLLVAGIQVVLVVAALVAAAGRLPRVAGWLVFALYLEWMVIAFSYGKVDHDRFGFLVALAVLPTVGLARWGDDERDERAGWALRAIQVAVVATYFLAAWAKLRYGGLEWVNGSTLTRAIVRRGTFLSDPLLDVPVVLQATQYGIIAFELASPLLLVPGRWGRRMLALAVAFHLVTFASITIIFLPHVMCLLAFLPLEKIRAVGSGWKPPQFDRTNDQREARAASTMRRTARPKAASTAGGRPAAKSSRNDRSWST